MSIYTPRGLKIRIPAPSAFTLLARLWKRDRHTDAFRVLKTCEAIESIPDVLSFTLGLAVAIGFRNWVWAIVPARVVASLLGLFLTQMGLFGLLRPTGVLALSYLWTWLSGYGLLAAVGIGLTFRVAGAWGAAFWILGGFVAFLARESAGIWISKRNFQRAGHAATSSEVNFFNAYRLHAHQLGIALRIRLDDAELESDLWRECLADYAAKYPKAVARFDDDTKSVLRDMAARTHALEQPTVAQTLDGGGTGQSASKSSDRAPTEYAGKYTLDEIFDDPKMAQRVSELVGTAFEEGRHDFRAFIGEVVETLGPDATLEIGPGIEWAWELVRKEADTSGRMTTAESVSAVVATLRTGGELNHKPVSRSEPTIHADCDTGAKRIVAGVQQTTSHNRWTGGKTHLVFPPLPPDLRGQSGAVFQSFVFTAGVGQEVALFLLDDPDFARELGGLKPFHLVAKCGMAETSAGMIAFILWSVSSVNGHVVDYEQLLNPFNPETIELVSAAARQSHLKVVILDSVQSKTEGFLEFDTNFGLDKCASMLAEIRRSHPPANFARTRSAFFAEFSLEELKDTE